MGAISNCGALRKVVALINGDALPYLNLIIGLGGPLGTTDPAPRLVPELRPPVLAARIGPAVPGTC